jgi:hypothetical protein
MLHGDTPVPYLIALHLLQDGATCAIGPRQPLKVAGEMAFDLTLGLGEKAEVPTVAKQAKGRAEGK